MIDASLTGLSLQHQCRSFVLSPLFFRAARALQAYERVTDCDHSFLVLSFRAVISFSTRHSRRAIYFLLIIIIIIIIIYLFNRYWNLFKIIYLNCKLLQVPPFSLFLSWSKYFCYLISTSFEVQMKRQRSCKLFFFKLRLTFFQLNYY